MSGSNENRVNCPFCGRFLKVLHFHCELEKRLVEVGLLSSADGVFFQCTNDKCIVGSKKGEASPKMDASPFPDKAGLEPKRPEGGVAGQEARAGASDIETDAYLTEE